MEASPFLLGLLSLASVRGAFSFRLSNLFTNGLKSVLPVMNAVLQITTIFQIHTRSVWIGPFWSELKDTLRILLKARRLQDHPLLDQFAADIARDHGRSGKLSLHSGEVLDNTKGAKLPPVGLRLSGAGRPGPFFCNRV